MKAKKSTQFDNLLSFKLINQHITEATNISDLARSVGITPNLMWLYVKGQRKWPIDTWLRTYTALGGLKINEKGISLSGKINKTTVKSFRSISK